jgi:hypothetical protein
VFYVVCPASAEGEVFRRKDSYRREKGRCSTGMRTRAFDSLSRAASFAGEVRSV